MGVTQSPHVLWLSKETPDRHGQGGQRRQYFQIRELLKLGAKVTVATVESSQSAERIRELAHYVPLRYSRVRRTHTPEPTRLARSLRVTKVVVTHPESFALLDGRTDRLEAPWLLDFQNVPSRWFSRIAQESERDRWARIERRILASASAALACSPAEVAALVKHGQQAAISVARNGIAPDEWPTVRREQPRVPSVAMFGSWWYPPTREGAVWFATEVWPLVIKEIPQARLLIAGRSDPPPELKGAPGAMVVGPVKDLVALFARATAVAVPLLMGPGTPMKFAESLASGTAVIATADAAGGLTDAPAVISNDAGELAAGAVAVLSDPDLARDLGVRGRSLAFESLTWAKTQAPLINWIWS